MSDARTALVGIGGARRFFASCPPGVNSRLVDEPDGEATFQWVLAQR